MILAPSGMWKSQIDMRLHPTYKSMITCISSDEIASFLEALSRVGQVLTRSQADEEPSYNHAGPRSTPTYERGNAQELGRRLDCISRSPA